MQQPVCKCFWHLKSNRFISYSVSRRNNYAIIWQLVFTNHPIKRYLICRRLHRLWRCRNFIQKQNAYDEYDAIIDELKSKRVEVANLPSGVGFTVAGAVCMGMSVVFFIVAWLSYSVFSSAREILTGRVSSKLDSGFTWWVIGLSVLLLGGIAMFVIGLIRQARRRKLTRESKEQAGEEEYTRLGQLIGELNSFYMGFGYCATGSYYTNPKILKLLKDKILSGRAYTIPDAIQILHRDARISAQQIANYMNSTLAVYSDYGDLKAPFFPATHFYVV